MKHLRIIAPLFALAFSASIALAQDPKPTPEPTPTPTEPQNPPAPPTPAEEAAPVAEVDTSAESGMLLVCRNAARPSVGAATDPSAQKRDTVGAMNRSAVATQNFAERRLCQSLEGIRLTNEQKTRVDSVATRFADSVVAITAEETLTNDQRRLLGTRDNEVRAVLTAEQQATFDRNLARLQNPNATQPPRR